MRSNSNIEIKCAYSFDYGIVFFSTCNKEYSVISTIDVTGNIKTMKVKNDDLDDYTESISKNNILTYITELVICLIVLISFLCVFIAVYLFLLGNYRLCSHFAFGIPTIIFTTMLLTSNITSKSNRFHSAEHMVINAYDDLNRIPSLEEVRKYSRFSNNCGTNLVVRVILIFGSLFVCSFITNTVLCILSLSFSLFLIQILYIFNLLNWGQFFTTLPATDRELEVAIEGMKCWYDNECKFQASEKET